MNPYSIDNQNNTHPVDVIALDGFGRDGLIVTTSWSASAIDMLALPDRKGAVSRRAPEGRWLSALGRGEAEAARYESWKGSAIGGAIRREKPPIGPSNKSVR